MTINKIPLVVGALVVLGLLAFGIMGGFRVQTAGAAAFPGGETTEATTTTVVIGAGATTILAATSTQGCTARLIGTGGSIVVLSFSDAHGARATGSSGYTQAASTTVAYDSALYGCGAIYGYSYSASLIKIAEMAGSR